MALFGLFRDKRQERTGFLLYGAAVQAARDPFFYTQLQVPDTLDGRFDMVGLHVFLLIRRLTTLEQPGPALAQAMFDAMFSDMDVNLRELGVGDLSVGKRVRAMWEAFHGRSQAYAQALDARDPEALAGALARNVWRDDAPPQAASGLAALVLAQDLTLAEWPRGELLAGRVAFAAPA